MTEDVKENLSTYITPNEDAILDDADRGNRCYQKRDYENAVSHYKEANKSNLAAGHYGLATCYKFGHGIDQNFKQAFIHYQKAAEDGLATAEYELANCYRYQWH
jgi:TPR repeat protein